MSWGTRDVQQLGMMVSWVMTWDGQVVPVLQAHFFPAALSVPSGMNPEWAQDTGDASHLSLPWLPPGMLSAICRCVPPWDTPAPSWEQAGMMGTRIVGTRELTPALRKLVSESRALLDILLILTNWH